MNSMKDEAEAIERGTQEAVPITSPARHLNSILFFDDEKHDLHGAEYNEVRDVEALLHGPAQKQLLPAEYTVSSTRKLILLTLYFLLSLALTLSNKAIMTKV